MARIGIENISVFGMPPVDFVKLAAELGCQHISTGLTSFPFGVEDHPPFSLRDEPALRREMIAALRDTGVSISLGEGCTIRPGTGAADLAPDLDLFAELGCARINTVSMEPDLARTAAEFAALTELCAARGMRITTEFAPGLAVDSLPAALAMVGMVGRDDFRLLIDTMHLGRTGGTAADLAALDPALIDYVQLADATLAPRFATYMEEAMFERMCPGEGELALAEVLAVLPADRVYALEVPLRAEALAGVSARERLGRCVKAARRLLAEAHGTH